MIVQNLSLVKGRWKYRKVIPARLRPHIDGNITEFVRWLGQGKGHPSPEILTKYAAFAAECDALIGLAEKRLAGAFDELSAETIAHIIANARSEMLEEDESGRFDDMADVQFEALNDQLSIDGVEFAANPDTDRRWNNRQEDTEGTLAVWRHEYARGQISEFVSEEAFDRCTSLGLYVDRSSIGFRSLAKAYLALLIEIGEATLKRQRGEPVPTPPPPAPKAVEQLRGVPEQTLSGLVADWWKEAKAGGRTVSTYEAYERAARQLADFLKHDDANRVSQKDVIRFKDYRLEQGVSPKTIKDGDLSGIRAVFGWGLANGRVRTNPADGVTVIKTKKVRTRSQGFTDDEAVAVLNHAYHHTRQPRESPKVANAKRWIPWLCAYTGARLGEMAQLRKKDLRLEGDTWVIVISPDAVTVKGGEFREVPLHPHLVDTGFPQFVEDADEGFLFLQPSDTTEKAIRGAWRTVKNRVTDFVREVVKDPTIQPNHAWRHRLITQARNLNIRRDVTDAITGHTTPGVAADYGDDELVAKTKAIRSLPYYPVATPPMTTDHR